MVAALTSHILEQVEIAVQLYHRLVLVVRPPRSTTALRDVAVQCPWPRVNINLALSARLLDLTARQHALRAAGEFAGSYRDREH